MSEESHQLDYPNLRPVANVYDLVYGPVKSRRYGNVLGINLLDPKTKTCDFDCVYCDLGRTQLRVRDLKTSVTYPSLEDIEKSFRAKATQSSSIDGIGIVGNGEPTLHPLFPQIIPLVVKLRDELFPGKKIYVMTNGSHLNDKHISHALSFVDERVIKLDAGSDRLIKTVNIPLSRFSTNKILASTRKLKSITIQSIFIRGTVDNTALSDLEEWFEVIGMLNPSKIHIMSINKIPATSGLIAVPEGDLDTIAAQLERKTRLRATVIA